jgi:hypothetical protein
VHDPEIPSQDERSTPQVATCGIPQDPSTNRFKVGEEKRNEHKKEEGLDRTDHG